MFFSNSIAKEVIGIRCNVKLFTLLMIICFIFTVSSASAVDSNQTNSTHVLTVGKVAVLNVDEEIPDVPDLVVNDTVYVTSDNVDDIFTDGKLSSRFDNKTLIYSQKFVYLVKI